MKTNCRVCNKDGVSKRVIERYFELSCVQCKSTSFYFTEDYHYGDDQKYSDLSYLNDYEMRWAHDTVLNYLKTTSGQVHNICLEIGCFNGQFVNEIRSLGIEAYGTDVNEKAINYGRERYFPNNSEVLSVDFSKFLLNANTLILIDVLEHFERPMDFFRDLPSNISKVIISSPLANKLFYDKSDFPPHHFTRIDPDGLIRQLSKLGFNQTEALYIQSSGLLFIRNLLGRIKFGWNKKWYEGSAVFTVRSGFLRKFYSKIDNWSSAIFNVIGLRYSAFVVVVSRDV
jgi:hypothetical protein